MFTFRAYGFMALVVLLGLFTGCTKDQGNRMPAPPKITLKIHFWYNEHQDNWQTVYREFERLYPDINIEAVTSGDHLAEDYLKRLDLAAASGEQIDVIFFPAPNHYSQRASLQMLEPLNRFIEKDGFQLKDEYHIDPTIGGKVYALPGKISSQFVMLNKNALDEAGLPVPANWGWDEFLEYARLLTKGEGEEKRYGTFFYRFYPNSNPFPYYRIGRESDRIPPEEIQMQKRLLEIRKQAEVMDRSATPLGETLRRKLNYRMEYFNQKASMILAADYMIAEAGGTDQIPAKFKTVFAPYPRVKPEAAVNDSVNADLIGVYSKSMHKEAAYRFIRWYTTEGILLQGRYIPSWKKYDVESVVDTILASAKSPDKVDRDSLLYVIKTYPAPDLIIPAPFQDEVNKVYEREVMDYLLGKKDVDDVIRNAMLKGNELTDNDGE